MGTHLAYAWYPAILATSIASFGILLSSGWSSIGATYLPITVAGLSIVVLEQCFPERTDWRPARSDVLADVAFLALVQIALARLLAFLATIVLAGWMHEHSKNALWPHDWPLPMQVLCMVLAVDLMRYWLHRACHNYPVLWRLHEVHHSPDLLYTLNVGRFHPLEKVLHFTLDSVPFVLLGVAPEVLAGYFLLYSVNGFFQHSNVKLRYGWLNYVVGSAETHRWHHARDPKTASCNFSNTTIVWDLIFGTWYLPRDRQPDVGIPDRQYPKGFLEQMVSPFRRRHESRG